MCIPCIVYTKIQSLSIWIPTEFQLPNIVSDRVKCWQFAFFVTNMVPLSRHELKCEKNGNNDLEKFKYYCTAHVNPKAHRIRWQTGRKVERSRPVQLHNFQLYKYFQVQNPPNAYLNTKMDLRNLLRTIYIKCNKTFIKNYRLIYYFFTVFPSSFPFIYLRKIV